MIKLLKYLSKQEWLYVAIALVFIVLGVWLDLKIPDYMREITALVETEGSAMGDVLIAGAKMLGCAFASAFTTIVVGFTVAKIAAGFSKTVREKVYCKTIDFGREEISEFSTASLITRTTNDIQQIQMFIAMGLQAICRAPIMAIWAALKIAGISWQWTTVTVAAVVLLLLIMIIVMTITIPKFRMMQTLTDNLNRVARENLTGIRVVRAYNAEDYQQAKFEVANNDLTRTQLFTSRSMSFMMPTINIIMTGLTLAIYWVGMIVINDAEIPQRLTLFSDMVVFSSYAMQIVMSFMMILMAFFIGPRAMVAAGRVNEVLNTEISIKDGTKTEFEEGAEGTVEFKKVTFQYPDAEHALLRDITFKANKGETVAFIGSTGAGKSSLIQLIPRFYDATEGEILVDGVDVRELSENALRDKIGYVTQRPIMFKGTIESNVAYGEEGEIDESRVQKALEISHAEEFVSSLEDGIHAKVSQGGANFSGGQKQRLAIARAVYKNPEIFIFDDSFSALDYKTDREVRSDLARETSGATKLIVAQRIGTIMDADQIIVLDNGHIVGKGKHKELLQTCDVYREIAESQLSKEELDIA